MTAASRRALFSVVALVGLTPLAAAPPAVDPALLAGLKARSIGPATMSGRIAAIDAVAADPETVYVGVATGGLWKSTNGGLTFEPLFDEQPVASIGAVAAFQPSPDLVWVGTGEGNPRNSVSIGNGVYKSLDGGRTWSHLGLEKSERIHRILLHPSDPDTAWVAALGPLWGEGTERGVFKTTDGGRTWQKVLYVDERTGAADLVIDPGNPQKLFAAMWDHRRWPWFFRSGGPGSGIHVTHDGGSTWKRLEPEEGLPKGDLGRVGLAIAPSDPRIVYAFVEAEGKDNLILRSEDGGRKWKTVAKSSEQTRLGNRPFYYADLRVDPQDPNRLYSLWSQVSVSTDGGRTFEILVSGRQAHPDHHAMWISPRDPALIYDGNDGGVSISRDRGASWAFVGNLPLAQYYHVAVDMETPFNVYGGMQDNGSWRGPSAVWENGGIRNHHWQEVGFGDGFATLPMPDDPRRGYAMSQGGYLMRWDLGTGERRDIRPPGPPDGTELRFNWNAAIAQDPFEPGALYYGSQFLHKSTDRGESWTSVSPDLTTNNPDWQKQAESGGLTPDVTSAENYTTILTIAPSPLAPGLMWVGTDDGRIQLTRDGGATWTSLEGNVVGRPGGVPANTWIPHIEASKFDAGEAFVVFDDHRRSNFQPYVYRTRDYGRSWTSLVTKELRGYALVLEQDPVDRDLLFLGTEFGLWISLDGGARWLPFTHGFPTVSAMAMTVHPRDGDLVVGTHGRSAYVLDDVAPLRTLSAETMAAPLHLFPVAPAIQYRVAQTGGARFPGDGEFRGANRPYGALLTYSLNLPGLPHPRDEEERARKVEERAVARRQKAAGPVSEEGKPAETAAAGAEGEDGDEEKGPQVAIEVEDPDGKVVRTFKAPAKLGVNRAAWDLRADLFEEPKRDEPRFFEPSGPAVPPGDYTVTVKYEETQATQTVRVLPDPRQDVPVADRRAQWEAVQRAGALQERATAAIERLRRTRADVETVTRLARAAQDEAKEAAREEGREGDPPPHQDLLESAKKLRRAVERAEKALWVPPRTKGIVYDRTPWSRIGYALRVLQSTFAAPSAAQLAHLDAAERALAAALPEVDRLYAEDVARFREAVHAADLAPLAED